VLLTLVRQLTFERQRREMTNYLRQYTSRALAERLAEDPDPTLVRRAEVREVSLYFSDLWGFTGLSERLGAERTQYLLNNYLERMSEVLDRHEAFINKFIGDAVMAFFNPVLNPQPDHARRACLSALDTTISLQVMIADRLARGDDPAFADLRMRIGLASGQAVVGDCGSERKADYTCIGDTVNLAARLEPANKVFGTTILCPESTRRAAGDEFIFRYLAELQVKGKTHTVPVYELMGLRGKVPREQIERAEVFAAGVGLYREAQWAACIRHFEGYMQAYGEDLGAQRYIRVCQQYRAQPPPGEWTGALELTEK
jgi:adenylate cyclase